MKCVVVAVLVLCLLTGCSKKSGIEPALELRNSVINARTCSFIATITADYGDEIFSFKMSCVSDESGKISFRVMEPDTIENISGYIDTDGGELVFDDQVLVFPLLTDEYLSPISVPWLLIRTVRGGFIVSGGGAGEYYKLQIDDSFNEERLSADIWLDEKNFPVYCDFLWDNKRILSAEITDFTIK